MLALLQRVSAAEVRIAGEVVGAIGRGLLVFVCAEPGDTVEAADRLVDKVLKLRVFADPEGRMNLDVQASGGALLVVSQFTLAADTARGNRPGFSGAARPELAIPLYERVLGTAKARGIAVESGRFGADMQVTLTNDGPVTIPLTIR